jgi:hypothetical protein
MAEQILQTMVALVRVCHQDKRNPSHPGRLLVDRLCENGWRHVAQSGRNENGL